MPRRDYNPIEDRQRDTLETFMSYMYDNAPYFEYVFRMELSNDNIKKAWKEVMYLRANYKEQVERIRAIREHSEEFLGEGRRKKGRHKVKRPTISKEIVPQQDASNAPIRRGDSVLGGRTRTRRRGSSDRGT
jgi:hypothetical protein